MTVTTRRRGVHVETFAPVFDGPTIGELLKDLRQADPDTGKVSKASPLILEGLTPRPFSLAPGVRELTPEEFLLVRVPVLEIDGSGISGFQRPFQPSHARKIARAMAERRVFPLPILSIDGGFAWADEGQHRCAGAVIARTLLRVEFRDDLDPDQRRQLFADQARARFIDASVLVLSGTAPHEVYVQQALSDETNPWHDLIDRKATRGALSSALAARLLSAYVYDRLGISTNRPSSLMLDAEMKRRWNDDLADELAGLIKAFGDKHSNPAAFRHAAVRGIAECAIIVFRRGGIRAGRRLATLERWNRWMPRFDFRRFPHAKSHADFAELLVAHWNKKLLPEHRVYRG